MRTNLVYDLPTRLFHWLFAGFFLLSFVVAKTIDDESLVFSYHMLSGLMLAALVIWRIAWGFIGTKHARFSGFNLNPIYLKDYFVGLISGSKKRWAGHNPASSWAALMMFAFTLGLVATGYLMTTGYKEEFEDIHELISTLFIFTAGMHVAGILFHLLRHKDAIALSMIDGKKENFEPNAKISSIQSPAAILLLTLIISFGFFLYKNFDSQSRALRVFGQTLQLGEAEDDSRTEVEIDVDAEVETDDN